VPTGEHLDGDAARAVLRGELVSDREQTMALVRLLDDDPEAMKARWQDVEYTVLAGGGVIPPGGLAWAHLPVEGECP
jgi:hypothetical protein